MIKKFFLLVVGSWALIAGFAQYQRIPPTYTDREGLELSKDFTPGRIFLGGSIALGVGNYSFNIGATPEVGYSFNDWLDAGVAVNINYQSIRADPYYNNNTRQRSFNYGGGPFLRVYPLKFLFFQGQLEHNWEHYSYQDMNSGAASIPSFNIQSNSFLAGIGYSQRIVGQSSFYTVLMIDLLTDQYSPYRDYNNSAIPILRAGFNFYLHSGRK
jgi:hypothetical protein